MATHRTHGLRRALVGGLATLLLACGSPTPPSSTGPPTVSPTPTGVPAADTLRIAVPTDPTSLLLPGDDTATRLVQWLLHATLYRLDDRLVPQPDLAAAAPTVSANGLTWRLTLAAGRRFSDDTAVVAADVVTTYQLALSPDCPFGELCGPLGRAVSSVSASGARQVVFTLRRPWVALETDVMARLPILPGTALAASLVRLLAGAKGVTPDHVGTLLDAIHTSTESAACAESPPPASCDVAFYRSGLEQELGQAGITLPAAAAYRGGDGQPDPSAYATALLGRLQALGAVLGATGKDQLAAALPLLDIGSRPIGAGPFALTEDTPGQALELTRWGVSPGPGAPARVRLVVIGDPTVAATALQAGDIDWLPDATVDMARALATSARVVVAARPSDTLRLILFNVRAGHPYADLAARSAFVACLGEHALAADAAAQHLLGAADLLAPGSWAAHGDLPWPSDAAVAEAALRAGGWQRGADGVYGRDGMRLQSSIAVRPGQTDLLALLTAASTRLRACGIQLDVRATTLSGQDLLATLEYPNTFDTYLASQAAGVDPDDALGRLAGARTTTAADPGDANFGGWRDPMTDQLLARGLRTAEPASRAAIYGSLEARLASQAALLPIVWDPAYAAVAARVTNGGRPVDPSRVGYDRDVLSWRLSAP